MPYFRTNEPKKYDVIIVGAGPAGCSCAFELREHGKSVLLLDKSDFPRHKPCAGGITKKALDQLPIDISHLIQHCSYEMVFKFDDHRAVELQHDLGSCVMVIREEFDHYFFNETLKQDVDFEKIKKIENIEYDATKVRLYTNDTEYECSYLIGADGANSIVRKLTTDLTYENPVYAFEGLVTKTEKNKQVKTEFIFNKRGYAWVFPKEKHFNVGIGNLINNKKSSKAKRKDLYDFVYSRFGTKNVDNITGFPIGTEGTEYTALLDKVFLVGDAAGLSESLLGEGIYNAIVSGKYAAKSIIKNEQEDGFSAKYFYNTFLEKLTSELRLYKKGSKLLYGYPKISYFLIKLGLGKKFMDGYSEGKTITEILKKKKLLPNY